MDNPQPNAKANEKEKNPNRPGVIYLLTSPSGKQYVGQSVRFKTRMREHGRVSGNVDLHNNRHLYIAIKKYGWKNFKKEILLRCPAYMLNHYETQSILLYDTLTPRGYNIQGGGNSNRETNAETKAKLSEAAKNRDYTKYRTREDGKDLPKYLRRCDIKEASGYRISKHPNCNSKTFADKSKSLDENLRDALEFLDRVNKGEVKVEKKVRTGPKLPKFLHKYGEGYRVSYKHRSGNRISERKFVDSNVTNDENLAEAIAFLTGCEIDDEVREFDEKAKSEKDPQQ